VLISCDSYSLKFLNSWGHMWGGNGCFRVEDHTVLELDEASSKSSICFYYVYNAAYVLTAEELYACMR
jgi:C1A family cysteine protease